MTKLKANGIGVVADIFKLFLQWYHTANPYRTKAYKPADTLHIYVYVSSIVLRGPNAQMPMVN